jgi:hypothetical protein
MTIATPQLKFYWNSISVEFGITFSYLFFHQNCHKILILRNLKSEIYWKYADFFKFKPNFAELKFILLGIRKFPRF